MNIDQQKFEKMENLGEPADNDVVAGYSVNGNKVGFFNINTINDRGYVGARWALSNASPEGEPIGNMSKLAEFGELIGLGCYLVRDDHTRRKLASDTCLKFSNGETAVLDGTMGHWQWGTGMVIYYAHWVDSTYEYEAFDIKPISGHFNYKIPIFSRTAFGYATMDRTNNKLVSYANAAAQYRGGNNDSSLDSAFNSQLGIAASSMTAESFAAAAQQNGKMWDANWYCIHYITVALKRVLFHNRNIQASVAANTAAGLMQGGTGAGVDCPSWDKWSYYPYVKTSAGQANGDKTGTLSCTITNYDGNSMTINNIPSFFGLHNDYKYLWTPLRGAVLKNNTDENSQSLYVRDVWDGTYGTAQPTNLTSLKLVGRSGICSSEDWIKRISSDYLFPLYTEFGGSESTYMSDRGYPYTDKSGVLRVPLALGVADNGGAAGSCCLSGDSGLGWTHAHGGAFLCEAANTWDCNAAMA